MNCSTEDWYFGPADYTLLLPDVESEDLELYFYLDVEVG